MQPELPQGESDIIIRQTWLSRRPARSASRTVFVSLAALAVGTAFYWRDFLGAAQWMPATPAQVFHDLQLWRLWTTLFAHADIGHFGANCVLFVTLGYFLSGYFGATVFPAMAFFFGGITNLFSLATYPSDLRLIGASGLVSWMGGAWLALYFFLNRQISVSQRALRSAGVALLLFAPSETFDPQISYRTHLIGFVLGLVWGYFYFQHRKREFRAAEVTETVIEEFNTGPLD